MIQLKVSFDTGDTGERECEAVRVNGGGLQTMLNCIDNSGAAVVECVNVLKKKRPATVGEYP